MGFNYRTNPYRISKTSFYRNGGFSNPNQFRKMEGKAWAYYSY